MAPQRIELKRTKGWRMPANTVKVDRSSRWGNPFHVGQKGRLVWEPMTDSELLAFDFEERRVGDLLIRNVPPNRIIYFDAPLTIEDVLLLYHKHVIDQKIDLAPLRGKNLGCWCKLGQPCHSDILLDIANR